MKKYMAKMVLMVEMQISDPDAVKDQIAMALDSFREATQPANEWGLTFWMPTSEDLEEMAASGDLLPNPGVHIREVETSTCKKCGTALNPEGYCGDATCPFSDSHQDEEYTEE